MSEQNQSGREHRDRRSQGSDRRAGSRERQLEQALADRSRFIARLSAEMRSPLEAIQGLADVLGDSNNLDENDSRQVDAIGKEADALRRMIDDLLDMSRIGSGDMELLTEPFTPAALCDEIGLAHRHRAEEKGLDFRVEIADGVPPIVVGDRHRVRQILVNLVSNAIKFTETGSVVLSVQAGASAENNHIRPIQFVVKDTGPGIPAAHAPFLFEPYRQLHSQNSKVGTGIGLTISRMLTELMGGTIWFTSDEAGSTFICQLPLREGRRVSDQEAVAKEAELIASPGWKASVLVVDDSEVTCLLTAAQLTQLGHNSTLVSSGADALEVLKKISVDVVLMDWHMSGMDGLETAQLVRAMGSTIAQPRIVAMSANTTDTDREECLAAGMDDFLTKPISLATLGEMLKQWAPGAPAKAPEGPAEISVDQLIALAGDQETARSRVSSFVNEMRTWRRHLTDAVATDHLDSARDTAEAMRIASENVAATALAEACGRFERKAVDGADIKALLTDVLEAANEAKATAKVQLEILQQSPRAA